MKQTFLLLALLTLLKSGLFAQQIPDFNLPDCNGVTHHLYDELAAGNTVIINFCAGWCVPCRAADPKLETVYRDLCAENGTVKVYGMLFENGSGQATDCTFGQQYAAQYGLTFPIFTNIGTWYPFPSGLTGEYVDALGLSSIPTFYVIIPNTADPGNSRVITLVGDSPTLEDDLKFALAVTVSGDLCGASPYSATLTSNFPSGNTWSTGATTQSINVEANGTFGLFTSAGGCPFSASKSINFTTEPVAGTASISTNAICSDGQFTLNYTGGNTQVLDWVYRYPPDATWHNLLPHPGGSFTLPGNRFPPGSVIKLAVRAARDNYFNYENASCAVYSNEVDLTIMEAPAITVTDGFCGDPPYSATLTSNLATGNLWSTGETTQSIIVQTAGTYTVTTNGCSDSKDISFSGIPVAGAASISTNTVCLNGTITLSYTPGTAENENWSLRFPPDNFWYDDFISASDGPVDLEIPGPHGTVVEFAVSATNGNGNDPLCRVYSNVVTLTVLGPTITMSGDICGNPPNSMTLTSDLSSGNVWSTGETTQSITAQTTGTYTVTALGCSDSKLIEFTSPPVAGTASISANTVCRHGSITFDYTPGSAEVDDWVYRILPDAEWHYLAYAGSGPFDRVISHPPGTVIEYAVRARNGNYFDVFCYDYSNITTLTVLATPGLFVASDPCLTPSNSITLISTVSSGNVWSTGETTQSITVQTSGTYTVTANGCSSSKTIVPAAVAGTASLSASTVCPDGMITFSYTPGTADVETWVYRFPPDANWNDLAPATNAPFDQQIPLPEGTILEFAVKAVNNSGNTTCIDYSNTVLLTVTCGAVISGAILWENDGASGVNNTAVQLTGDETQTATTTTDGTYSFAITSGSNFTVTPTKSINKLNGVTSADVTAIQQHVTLINPITNPYKQVAADVNKSNSISTFDATVLNQALLGNPAALAQVKTSWRFVPTAYTMNIPPWGFPEKIVLTGVSGSQMDQDFFGVKTGDVVSTFANPANFGAGEPLVLWVQDQRLQAGQEISAVFRGDQLADLASFQFALFADPTQLRLLSIEPETSGGLPITVDNFGTYNVAEGEIRAVWAPENAEPLEEATILFRLRFEALESGALLSEVLQLNDDALPGRSYNSKMEESGVALKFAATTATSNPANTDVLQLLQNHPNPFTDETTIGFVLPTGGGCDAQLRIFDATGRELWRLDKYYPAGYNAETVHLSSLTSSGVLYYELTTPYGTLTKRMLQVAR